MLYVRYLILSLLVLPTKLVASTPYWVSKDYRLSNEPINMNITIEQHLGSSDFENQPYVVLQVINVADRHSQFLNISAFEGFRAFNRYQQSPFHIYDFDLYTKENLISNSNTNSFQREISVANQRFSKGRVNRLVFPLFANGSEYNLNYTTSDIVACAALREDKFAGLDSNLAYDCIPFIDLIENRAQFRLDAREKGLVEVRVEIK